MSEDLQTIIVVLIIIAAVAWSIKRIFFTKRKSCCGSVIGGKNEKNKNCDSCEGCEGCEIKSSKPNETNSHTQK